MRKIKIGVNQAGQRLDKFLQKYLREAPKSFLYKMLRKKNIKLNGGKASGSEKLEIGDVVTLYLADETVEKFRGRHSQDAIVFEKETGLDIIYENEHVALINKPAGMLSQKARRDDRSLTEQFVSYVARTAPKQAAEAFTPAICNRLDRNTSGIVIGGKTLPGLQKMSELLRERAVEKYYLTVVSGIIDEAMVVEGWISKEETANRATVSQTEVLGSSYIKTGYLPLACDGEHTLLRVRLYTGKSHQIRSHLASLSHPIIGDLKYGGCAGKNRRGQLLHAYELVFPELGAPFGDISGKHFLADVPAEFYQEEFVRKLLRQANINMKRRG